MADYISREAAYKTLTEYYHHSSGVQRTVLREALNRVPAADVRPVPPGGIGEMSDGYHTFNGLYYQRMVLFAALVKQNKDRAWKSHRHEDGELCFDGGWFIVGLDTPKGSYTYHYEDKNWDLFDCEELPVGKHWDGHTEDDVTRLLSLPEMRPVVLCRDCKHRPVVTDESHPYGFGLACPKEGAYQDMTCQYLCDDGYYNRMPADGWYCADGERRDDYPK